MSGLILNATGTAHGLSAFFAKEKDGMIAVVDLWPMLNDAGQAVVSTVTEEPQVVLYELAKRGYPINDRPVLYMDENDVWDQIIVHNGSFDNFRVLHAPTWERALGQLLSAGVISKSDMKRAPVVDKEFQIVAE